MVMIMMTTMIMKKLPVAFRVKSIHNPTVYDDDDGDDDDDDVDDSDGEWPFPPRFQYVRPCRHEIVQTGKGKGCLLAETGGSSSAEYDTRHSNCLTGFREPHSLPCRCHTGLNMSSAITG